MLLLLLMLRQLPWTVQQEKAMLQRTAEGQGLPAARLEMQQSQRRHMTSSGLPVVGAQPERSLSLDHQIGTGNAPRPGGTGIDPETGTGIDTGSGIVTDIMMRGIGTEDGIGTGKGSGTGRGELERTELLRARGLTGGSGKPMEELLKDCPLRLLSDQLLPGRPRAGSILGSLPGLTFAELRWLGSLAHARRCEAAQIGSCATCMLKEDGLLT